MSGRFRRTIYAGFRILRRRDPRRSVCVMDKDKGSNPGSTEVRSHETPIAVELWAVAEYNISLSFRYALV